VRHAVFAHDVAVDAVAAGGKGRKGDEKIGRVARYRVQVGKSLLVVADQEHVHQLAVVGDQRGQLSAPVPA
jgi:hypothetical protein